MMSATIPARPSTEYHAELGISSPSTHTQRTHIDYLPLDVVSGKYFHVTGICFAMKYAC